MARGSRARRTAAAMVGSKLRTVLESFRLGHFILNHLCCTLLHRGKMDSANQVETFESLCAFGGAALQMAFYFNFVALAL